MPKSFSFGVLPAFSPCVLTAGMDCQILFGRVDSLNVKKWSCVVGGSCEVYERTNEDKFYMSCVKAVLMFLFEAISNGSMIRQNVNLWSILQFLYGGVGVIFCLKALPAFLCERSRGSVCLIERMTDFCM